jgi:hypothetical protein
MAHDDLHAVDGTSSMPKMLSKERAAMGGRPSSQSSCSVQSDFVSCPELPDRGSVVASRRTRLIVYIVLCQLVQMFMSYDSGATSASLDTIMLARPGYWSTSDLSLLGAIDKIGTTCGAVVWGRLLQLFPTKCLLCIALGINTASTLLFGILDDKHAMFSTKFAMGVTQALQNVWGSVWTVTMAPPDSVTMWMAFGGISAAIGTGLGSAVAGFSTGNGLPYSFAFIVQAGFLGAFWIFQIATPARYLAMKLPPARTSSNLEATSQIQSHDKFKKAETTPLPARDQLRELWNNKVYVWTLVATCLNQYQIQGVQYFFILIFTGAWGLNKNFATSMTILVPGIGMGIGIALGPAYIDKQGGFSSPPGMARTLEIMQRIAILVALGSVCGMFSVYGKLRAVDKLQFPEGGDLWLYGVWISIIIIFAGHSACVAALTGINTEAVRPEVRSFASGVETSLRNMLGYFAGCLVPGVFMDIVAHSNGWDVADGDSSDRNVDKVYTYGYGLYFIFASGLLQYFIMGKARMWAQRACKVARKDALEKLRTAFMNEDLEELQVALAYAKTLKLQRTEHGEAVMGMANQVIGELRRGTRASSKQERIKMQVMGATPEQLRNRVLQLEESEDRLQTRIRELELERDEIWKDLRTLRPTVVAV